MSLDALVTTLVATTVNKLIQQDIESQRRLQRLKGKALRVHFTDINKQLVFFFDSAIKVQESTEEAVDCSVLLAITTAPILKDKTQLTALIKQDKLQIEGDIDVIQQFSTLLENMDIDIAEWLSTYTGDVVAHSIVRSGKQFVTGAKQLAKAQQRYLGEVLVEEWRLTPSALEIAHFADKVDDLHSQVELIEVRLNRIINQITTKAVS